MAERKLTRTAISRLAPQEKQYKVADGAGLYLLIKPNGSRLWRWNYRLGGSEKTISYGVYPDVSIEEARKLHGTARERLREGFDPINARRVLDRKAFKDLTPTVEEVAARWLKRKKAGWAPSHYERTEGRLKNYVYPRIGKRQVHQITTRDLVGVAERVLAVDTAHRVAQILSQVFRFAKQTGEIETNPADDLRGALPANTHKHFAAVTDPKRLGEVLAAFDSYSGGPVVKAALQLQPLLFTRPSELRLAQWHEFDLEKGLFTVPSSRMKRTLQAKLEGEPHLVPLSRQAVAILAELKSLTGPQGFVFKSNRRGKPRPFSDMALTAAVRALEFTNDELTLHGFRATARTLLDEVLNERVDIIEHQLAHRVKDALGRAYNRTAFMKERVAMMQRWANFLDSLKPPLR